MVDAEDMRRNGQALMLDADSVGPRGAGAQQTYLREKHYVLVTIVHQNHWKGIAVVPAGAAPVAGGGVQHSAVEEDGSLSMSGEGKER